METCESNTHTLCGSVNSDLERLDGGFLFVFWECYANAISQPFYNSDDIFFYQIYPDLSGRWSFDAPMEHVSIKS